MSSQELVLFSLPSFDIILNDAPPLTHDNNSPPPADLPAWLADINAGFKVSYYTLLAMSQQVHEDDRQDVADLKSRYEAVRNNYIAMATFFKAGLSPSPDHVTTFQSRITEASSRVAADVWAQIALHGREAEHRTAAVQQLHQIMARKDDALSAGIQLPRHATPEASTHGSSQSAPLRQTVVHTASPDPSVLSHASPNTHASASAPPPPFGSSGSEQLAALIHALSQSRQTSNAGPILFNRPPSYDGKDSSKFKQWWSRVERYMEIYGDSFPSDQLKIDWVGTLLTDHALVFHDLRENQTRSGGGTDSWNEYKGALAKRFKYTVDVSRLYRQMGKLVYRRDIGRYLTELRELNESVRIGGAPLKDIVTHALPKDITRMVYTRTGGIPETDEDFLDAVLEAGRLFENLDDWSGSPEKEKPGSTQERPKSSSRREKHRSDPAAQSSKGPINDKFGDNLWDTPREAFRGIDQADIDRYKAEKAACWRCGRGTHQTLKCFATKNIAGKTIPPCPRKPQISATSYDNKRQAEDEQETEPPPPAKRAKIASIMEAPLAGRIFEAESESEPNEEDF